MTVRNHNEEKFREFEVIVNNGIGTGDSLLSVLAGVGEKVDCISVSDVCAVEGVPELGFPSGIVKNINCFYGEKEELSKEYSGKRIYSFFTGGSDNFYVSATVIVRRVFD